MAAEKDFIDVGEFSDSPDSPSPGSPLDGLTDASLAFLRAGRPGDRGDVFWGLIARKAAALRLSGYDDDGDICRILGVDVGEFRHYVDLDSLMALLKAEVSRKIYDEAMSGDRSLLRFIAERKMQWTEKKDVNVEHSGTVGVTPVLNINIANVSPEPVLPASGASGASGGGLEVSSDRLLETVLVPVVTDGEKEA